MVSNKLVTKGRVIRLTSRLSERLARHRYGVLSQLGVEHVGINSEYV
jgi:hypothetical protein